MNNGILHSTLRQLQGFAGSRNLWLTFAAVVLLFAFTGPFGTMEQLRFLPRLGYWFILHAAAWSVALIFSVLGDVLLKDHLASMLWRMMIGSIFAAIPIGVITQSIQFASFGRIPDPASLATEIILTVPLCMIFCVITFMTMSAERFPALPALETADAPTTAAVPVVSPTAAAPLLQRLKPENRGPLLRLAVEDHYTLVTTTKATELILLRFSDAVRETGSTAGLQVHRSHWVADDFVAGLDRANGKLTLLLTDGSGIPVSRTHAAEVRARFG
ncbi:MAG: DNA-binding protein [Rhizobium sp.]|nr:DNA-binding protein [Rhizobium sp.]